VKLAMVLTDDEVSLKLHAVRLKQSGWSVVSSTFIEDALRQLETMPERPDVIVIDVYLRRKSDVEALKKLQTNPHTAAIPLILVGEDRVEPSLTSSFAAVVHKPVTTPALVDTILRLAG